MTHKINSLLRRAKFRIVTIISIYPLIYYGLRRITGNLDRLCVKENTDLVIEGYPRSANSSTVHSFLGRQNQPVKIAHHKHHAAQLLFAAKRNIPAVMLIRQPEQAILSNLALALEAQQRNPKAKKGTLTFSDVLLSWLAFYRAVENHTEHFVIAPFEEVTKDIDDMIRRINEKFGTDFIDQPSSKESNSMLGWHATPNKLRNGIKDELLEQFSRELEQSSKLRKMLDEANALYTKIITFHKSQKLPVDTQL
jgi:hypothetical protein